MEPRIEVIPEKRLVGFAATMSMLEDSTPSLWRRLMPRRSEIENRISGSVVSMRVYPQGMSIAEMFAPATEFEKWAAVEVTDGSVPEGMASYRLPGGLYAVFRHRGPASGFPDTMRFIFGSWLPASEYTLDDREHFEILPEGWSAASSDAWEDVCVPIRQ